MDSSDRIGTSLLDVQAALYGPNAPSPPPLYPHHGDDPFASFKRIRRRRQNKKTNDNTKNNNPIPRRIEPSQPPPAYPASQLPDGYPEELSFRGLAAYALIRTLSLELRLSPFTPNVFLRALALPFPNRLLGRIHVAILRMLLLNINMGYHWNENKPLCLDSTKKRKIDGLRYPLRAGDNLSYLDTYTWPIFYDDYCHITADILYSKIHDGTLYNTNNTHSNANFDLDEDAQPIPRTRRKNTQRTVLYLEASDTDDEEENSHKEADEHKPKQQQQQQVLNEDDDDDDDDSDEEFQWEPPKKKQRKQRKKSRKNNTNGIIREPKTNISCAADTQSANIHSQQIQPPVQQQLTKTSSLQPSPLLSRPVVPQPQHTIPQPQSSGGYFMDHISYASRNTANMNRTPLHHSSYGTIEHPQPPPQQPQHPHTFQSRKRRGRTRVMDYRRPMHPVPNEYYKLQQAFTLTAQPHMQSMPAETPAVFNGAGVPLGQHLPGSAYGQPASAAQQHPAASLHALNDHSSESSHQPPWNDGDHLPIEASRVVMEERQLTVTMPDSYNKSMRVVTQETDVSVSMPMEVDSQPTGGLVEGSVFVINHPKEKPIIKQDEDLTVPKVEKIPSPEDRKAKKVASLIDAFIQGKAIETNEDDSDELSDTGKLNGDEDDSCTSCQFPMEKSKTLWPQFGPLAKMRSGIPYHRLTIEDKLVLLEFLLDELLSLEKIAAKFTYREALTSKFETPYRQLPSSYELQHLENDDVCAVCGEEGDLLCCDGCISSYHRKCILISEHVSLPEGNWYCPECELRDPALFGPLRGGRKSSLDWFTVTDLEKSAKTFGMFVSNDETQVLPTKRNMDPNLEFLVIHGFVFCRDRNKETSPLKPLHIDDLQKFLTVFGDDLCSQWPLKQIPFSEPDAVTPLYFSHIHRYDPSSYDDKYRRAPVPEVSRKIVDLHTMDYEFKCKAADTKRLSDILTYDMKNDASISNALREGPVLFDPYQLIVGFMEKLESDLLSASLLDELWGLGESSSGIFSWRKSLVGCRSVQKLSKILLKLVDATHHRSFLDGWFEPARVKAKETEYEGEKKVLLRDDVALEDESLRRHWERACAGNVPRLAGKTSKSLNEWLCQIRPDLKPTASRSGKRKNVRIANEEELNSFGIQDNEKKKVENGVPPEKVNVEVVPGDLASKCLSSKPHDATQNQLDSCAMTKSFESNHVSDEDLDEELKRGGSTLKFRSCEHIGQESHGDTTLSRATAGLRGRGSIVEVQQRRKISEIEKEATAPDVSDGRWPIAGRKLFAPIGTLSPKTMRHLARNAGTVYAPFVVYSPIHEVGQVAFMHLWRKKLSVCRSFEEILLLIRILQAFLDVDVIAKCVQLTNRYKGSRTLSTEILCSQIDAITGLEYHFLGKRDHSSGRWVSSREIDLASMILERCRRRKAQMEKQAEKIRVEKTKLAKTVDQSKKTKKTSMDGTRSGLQQNKLLNNYKQQIVSLIQQCGANGIPTSQLENLRKTTSGRLKALQSDNQKSLTTEEIDAQVSKAELEAMKENGTKSSQCGNTCAPDSYVSATAAAKVVFSGHALELRRLLEQYRGTIPAEKLRELRKESEDKLQLALGADSMLGADMLDTLFRQVEESVTRSAGNTKMNVPGKSQDMNMRSFPPSSEQNGISNQEVRVANIHEVPTKINETLPDAHAVLQSQNSWQSSQWPVQISSNFSDSDPTSNISQNPNLSLHSSGVPQPPNPHSVIDCTKEAITQYQEQIRNLVRKFGGSVPQVEVHPYRELCCQILSQAMQMANLSYSREKILQVIDEAESAVVSEECRRVFTAPFTSRTPVLPTYPQPTNYNYISHQNVHSMVYPSSQQQQQYHHNLSLQPPTTTQQQFSQFTHLSQNSQGFTTGATGQNLFHGVPQPQQMAPQNYSNVQGQYYQDTYNNPSLGTPASSVNTFHNMSSSQQSHPHQFPNSAPFFSNNEVGGPTQPQYNGNYSYELPSFQPQSDPRQHHHPF